VPPAAKNDELIEAEQFLENLVRGVDSSLLDEWQKLRDPEYTPGEARPAPGMEAVAFTRQRPAFLRAVRNAVFGVLKALSQQDVAMVLEQIEPEDPAAMPWTRPRIDALLDAYFAGHQRIRLDPEARAAKHTHIAGDSPRRWACEQIVVDPEEWNDWSLKFAIDLDRCDAAGAVVLVLVDFAPVA
jgi:hypothetical protein